MTTPTSSIAIPQDALFSDAILRATFDEAPVGMVITDTNLRLLRVNKEYCRFLGYSRDELLTLRVPDFTHPDDLERDLGQAQQLAAGKIDRFQLEKRYIRKDQKVVWGRLIVRLVRGPDNRPMYCLAMIQDITASRNAQLQMSADVDALTRMQALSTRRLEGQSRQVLLQELMDAAVAIAGAQKGTLQVLEAEHLRIVAHHGHTPAFLGHFSAAENVASVCGAALAQGQRVVVEDVEKSPLFAGTSSLQVLLKAGVRAVQSTPLLTRAGQLVGVLTTQWAKPQTPDDRTLWRLDLLARQAADLIEQHRSDAALAAVAQWQAFLLKFTDALRPLRDPLAVQETAARLLAEELHVARALYFEVAELEGVRTYVVERNYLASPEIAPVIGRFTADEYGPSLQQECDAGRNMVVEDIEHEPRLSPVEREAYLALGIKAYVTTPLIKEGKWVAGISVHQIAPRAWTTSEIALIEEVAQRTWASVERARAETALRESEHRFRSLVDQAVDGIFLADAQGQYLEANTAGLQMLGYSLDELRKLKVTDVISAADVQRMPAQMAHLAGGSVVTSEWQFRRKDGSTFLGEVVGRRLPDGRLLGILRDITERRRAEDRVRQSEQQFQVLTRNLQSAVALIDASGSFNIVNPAFLRTFDLPEDTGILNINNRDWGQWQVFDEHRQLLHVDEHPVRKAAMTCTAVRNKLVGVKPPSSDELKWLLISAEPIVDAQGRLQRLICTYYDITQLKMAEEELKQAKAAAEHASRAKDQFIAVLSHELRTPLTPALAAVSMMEADLRLPTETREDLAMVRRNIALEVRLIADLLDVSRAISGKLHLEKRPVDVAQTIREAVRTVGADLEEKGQQITVETPGEPYHAFGDAARLQQLFWNLLRNANKFAPHGGHIAIRARIIPLDARPPALPQPEPEAPHDADLDVEVCDDGSGIAPELLPRLFSPFEQASEARTHGGLGLGLSICKAVVQLHSGDITARNNAPGKGACFRVTLPISRCPVDPRPQPISPDRQRASAPTLSTRHTTSLRILLVEDHPDTSRLMMRLLEAKGHNVTVASSVASALAAVEQATATQRFDLLISDLGLPDGSGHDLMLQLTQRDAATRGIAISGYGAPADLQQSKAAGFAEHLVKPLSPDQLLAAIARVTSVKQQVASNK